MAAKLPCPSVMSWIKVENDPSFANPKPLYFIAFLCDNFPKSTFDNTKKFPSHTYLEKLDPIKPSKIPFWRKIPTSGHTFLPPCYQIAKSLLSDFSGQTKCQNLYEAAKYIINNN